MKPSYSLLAAIALFCSAGRLPAQCADCGNGPPGPNGPFSPYGISAGCGGTCRNYYSEQEWLANDWCQCCIFNWGWQHVQANALTPRFAPTWRVEADSLFLLRDGDRNREFATLGPRLPGGRNVALNSESLPECLEGGIKATVSRSLSEDNNLLIEATYLGMHDWDANNSYRDGSPNGLGAGGNLASPFTQFGRPVQAQGLDFNTLVTIGYTSEIESAELNLRHRVGLMCGPLETSMLYGVRYMRIDETFDYFSQSLLPGPAGTTNTVNVQTGNELIGFQVGVLAAYRVSDRWWFEFDTKFALCQNSNEQQTLYTVAGGTPGAAGAFFFNAHQGCTAFIGDIDLVSYYQVTRYLTVKAGYQAIGIDGLAVALENFSNNTAVLTQGPAEINDNGSLFFHGPHLGAVFSW
jgi:hypothetical protein